MFFFSSRRRHTIFKCDWSSDVCSSDLRIVPASSTGCGRWNPCVRGALGGGGDIPSTRVGASEEGTSERGSRVGASDPEPSEGSTRVGASDGGGRSEDELPAPLDGVRSAAPPSFGAGESSSRRGRLCSPMGYPQWRGKSKFSRNRGNLGPADPPFSRPREKLKVYTPLWRVSADP